MKKGTIIIGEGRGKTKFFLGSPPEITDGEDKRVEMFPAKILVLEEKSDGVFLTRFTENGEECGDTWDLTIEDALHQANWEFEGRIEGWHDIPETINDEKIIEYLKKRRKRED